MTSVNHAETVNTVSTLALAGEDMADYFEASRDWRTKRHLEELERTGTLSWGPEAEQVDYRAIPGNPEAGLAHVIRVRLWCLGTAWAVTHYDSISGSFDTLVYRGRTDAARAYNHLRMRNMEVWK